MAFGHQGQPLEGLRVAHPQYGVDDSLGDQCGRAAHCLLTHHQVALATLVRRLELDASLAGRPRAHLELQEAVGLVLLGGRAVVDQQGPGADGVVDAPAGLRESGLDIADPGGADPPGGVRPAVREDGEDVFDGGTDQALILGHTWPVPIPYPYRAWGAGLVDTGEP